MKFFFYWQKKKKKKQERVKTSLKPDGDWVNANVSWHCVMKCRCAMVKWSMYCCPRVYFWCPPPPQECSSVSCGHAGRSSSTRPNAKPINAHTACLITGDDEQYSSVSREINENNNIVSAAPLILHRNESLRNCVNKGCSLSDANTTCPLVTGFSGSSLPKKEMWKTPAVPLSSFHPRCL